MYIISKVDLIKNVSSKWDDTYYGDCGEDKKKIGDRLRNEKPQTEEQITAIIGNSSWTDNRCSECWKDSPILVQLGEEPDYESATACICPECLKKALSLISLNIDNSVINI